MSSSRVLRPVSLCARPSRILTTHHIPRPLFQQVRNTTGGGPNMSTDQSGKDHLGGPGGQESPDPVARAKQNANMRNKVIAGMVLLGASAWFGATQLELVPGSYRKYHLISNVR